MIPKITRGGTSFKGAFQYYMHDKGSDTNNRVEWAETENMLTDDPVKAWKIMAYTAKEQTRLKEASGQSRAGRKLEKPVFAFSLAWHPEQAPDKDHMLDTARKAIEMLGLSEHEAVIVAHRDEPQKHVHVIVNRVHPLTGIAGDVRNSKRKFSDFAREYEREHGKIYCEQREENFNKRQNGEPSRYRDPDILAAWDNTDTGESFVRALDAKGYYLAQGRKRIVVIDPHGKVHNPTRLLGNIKTKHFLQRLADIDLSRLPNADDLSGKFNLADSAAQNTKDEKTKHEDETKWAAFEKLANIQLNTLQDSHTNQLDRLSLQYRRRMENAKRKLLGHYRLAAQKQQILELAHRVKHAPWWKRLLRMTGKDREILDELKLAYKNAHWRYREGLQTIVRQRQDDMQKLESRQNNERKELERHIQQQRQTGRFALEPKYHFLEKADATRTHNEFGRDYV